MNDDFLKQHRRSPRPEFATTLYKRINQPMSSISTFQPAMRRLAWAMAVLPVLLAVTMLISPSARAFAQTVLRQIDPITLTDEVRQEPEPVNQGIPLPDSTSTPIPAPQPEYDSEVAKAAARAGFDPILPAYVPAGYDLDEVMALTHLGARWQNEGMSTVARYQTAGGHTLEVQQTRFTADQQFPVGKNVVIDVTVRGQKGIWLEQADLSVDGSAADYDPVNLLMWDENGFVFALFSDSLPLEELLKVAESLDL